MQKVQFALSLLGLFAISWLALACGGASPMNQGPTHPGQLQSITLNPAMADAQDYPDGEVPFVATGVYMNPARTVTPQPAFWGVCQKSLPTDDVSVSNAGVAQCASGAVGAYSVFAYRPTSCNVVNQCGGGCTVVGTAQLNCP
jgi:hypothetical protein